MEQVLRIYSWYFYFQKVHGPTPSIFTFTGFSAVVPNGLLQGQSLLLCLCFLGNTSHAHLVIPWCYLASILSDFHDLGFLLEDLLCLLWAFLGTLVWRVLAILWNNSFSCALLDSLLLRYDNILQEISMASQTAWSGIYFLRQGSFLTLFVTFPLERLLGLTKALAEIGRLDLPTVWFSFGRQTGCVGRRSCITPVLILFNWHMSLVLSLIGFGGGDEIISQFQQCQFISLHLNLFIDLSFSL